MKKLSLVSVVLAGMISANAQAEVISCVFTEPFFEVQIDTKKSTVVRTEPNWDNYDSGPLTTVLSTRAKVVLKRLKKTSNTVHVPVYAVYDGGKEIMTLELSYKGSDHMSDFIYPYETTVANNPGGCFSDSLERHRSDLEGGY